jgi:hypothetical protein
MSLDLGIEFNETIEAMVCARLRASNSTFELMTDEGIVRKCSKTRIMGALAIVAGITAFSKERRKPSLSCCGKSMGLSCR